MEQSKSPQIYCRTRLAHDILLPEVKDKVAPPSILYAKLTRTAGKWILLWHWQGDAILHWALKVQASLGDNVQTKWYTQVCPSQHPIKGGDLEADMSQPRQRKAASSNSRYGDLVSGKLQQQDILKGITMCAIQPALKPLCKSATLRIAVL